MKLFWGDYHKATRHLTRDQHGAYFLLIGEAWRLGGALPDNDAVLAAWALCTPTEWGLMKPTIMAFFVLRRRKWTHDRVRAELAVYETISRQRKQAGKRGGSVKHGKNKGNSQANAKQARHNQNQNQTPTEELIDSSSDRRLGPALSLVESDARPELPNAEVIPWKTPEQTTAEREEIRTGLADLLKTMRRPPA